MILSLLSMPQAKAAREPCDVMNAQKDGFDFRLFFIPAGADIEGQSWFPVYFSSSWKRPNGCLQHFVVS